jgi:hypothetical protein
MNQFWKAFAGGFLGKLFAVLFVGVCAAFSFGPDKWIDLLLQGSSPYLTPSLVRGGLLAVGLFVILLLLLSIIRSPDGSSLTAKDLEYALAITGVSFREDKLGNRKRNIQIGVGFRNASTYTIKYFVDDMFVSVAGNLLTNPVFSSKGIVLRSGECDTFHYDVFKGLELPPEASVQLSINVSYGAPEQAAVRHVKREYGGVLRVTGTRSTLTANISGEDWDQPI